MNMKYTAVKIISIFAALVFALSTLTSCGGDKTTYKNDVAAGTVCDTIEATVPAAEGYYSSDSDYLGFYFEGADALIDGYEIRFAKASTNINEFGVFKAKDGQAAALKTLCESYLSLKLERWVAQADYIESEYPKMSEAQVKIFGNYVVYTILTKSDQTAVFTSVDGLLKQ
jgi:hypothetical protein